MVLKIIITISLFSLLLLNGCSTDSIISEIIDENTIPNPLLCDNAKFESDEAQKECLIQVYEIKNGVAQACERAKAYRVTSTTTTIEYTAEEMKDRCYKNIALSGSKFCEESKTPEEKKIWCRNPI